MKPATSRHLRQLIAQQAARMMAEEGVSGYAQAKQKAARQLGAAEDDCCLPSNLEVERELRLHHAIFDADAQPQRLHELRSNALAIMHLLDRFNPHLAGAVLDGTAGRHAETEIHLFADSLKEVELFLLNQEIPYRMEERAFRIGHEKRLLPAFVLEGRLGMVRLITFATDDLRMASKNPRHGDAPLRATASAVASLLQRAQDAHA